MSDKNNAPKNKNLRKKAEEMLLHKTEDIAKRSPVDVEHLVHDLEVHQIELEVQNEELQEAQVELKRAKDDYADLYDFAPVGYLSIDHNNIISKANLMAAQLLGAARNTLAGRRITSFIDPASMDVYYLHRKQALAMGGKQVCDVVMRRADGGSFYACLKSIKSGDAELHTAIIDLTERIEAERMLRKESAQLEAANRDLEAFAYSTAHDLRTPLRTISIYSKILLKNSAHKLDDEDKRKLDAIWDNAQTLSQLIDALLAYSRLGRQALSLSPINMEQLADQVCKECLADSKRKMVNLRISPLPQACGDPVLVRQVLFNLVANALKFTRLREEARIEIGGSEEEGETAYYIKDNGIGFNMDYKNKLFRVFERLHNETDFEGTGVGLAIVQRIISLHGGRVWAEGKVQEGAVFHFTLPKVAC